MLLPSQRSLFAIPPDVAYLNCGYMSPLPKASVEIGQRAMARKATPWQITAKDFFRELEELRGLMAQVIGPPATPDDIAIVPSVSYGMAVAAANLPLAEGQNVILLDEGFPSVIYPWHERAREAGAEVRLISRPDDDDWTSAVLAAIDDRTGVAALPVCHWTDGALLDLARIATRLREVGAALAVDATQSMGVMAFDLAAVQPDFVAVAGYKWLLGPYSVSYLWAAPRWHSGRPIEHNWITRKGSEDFAGLVRYRDDFQAGARRYDVGETSNFALVPVAIAGLRQLLEWTVPAIQAATTTYATRIVDLTAALGLRAVAQDRRAGHYLGLRALRGLSHDLHPRLSAGGVYVSMRGNALRVTPHVYNDDADLDRFIELLRATVTP